MATESYDVVVVGAGVSGVDACYRIQERLPGATYTLLESRADLGGTWDLFKYPGIRSDSDMFSFGFPFKPWRGHQVLTGGANIVSYLRETVAEFGIDQHIQYRTRLGAASWSSKAARWTLTVEKDGTTREIQAQFLYFGTGYYDYDKPLEAPIPGLAQFQGTRIHPQFWPTDLDYTNKKLVIIGSGATAITLLPVLAQKAAKVTMLQRSPTYIISVPQRKPFPDFVERILPAKWLFHLVRLQFVLVHLFFYNICRTLPGLARWALGRRTQSLLPKTIPLDPHFRPRYNPWDQRVCAAPDGDFFAALHDGVADIKTDTIKTVTAHGIQLASGESLDADVIITATGLRLRFGGGVAITVDGERVDTSQRFLWKGSMMQGVPNAAFAFGYANASWTLGADVTALGFTRLIAHLQQHGLRAATPTVPAADAGMPTKSMLDINSTYVQAAASILPRTSTKAPWTARTNYFYDWWLTNVKGLTDGLVFA